METHILSPDPLAAADNPMPPGVADREKLARYARDTWRSLDAMIWPGGLPADGLSRDADGAWTPSTRTSPTNIAAYLWSMLAAEALSYRRGGGPRRLDKTLRPSPVWSVPMASSSTGTIPDRRPPETGRWTASRAPLPLAVDNGWLATALIMVRNARPAFRERAEALLSRWISASSTCLTTRPIPSASRPAPAVLAR